MRAVPLLLWRRAIPIRLTIVTACTRSPQRRLIPSVQIRRSIRTNVVITKTKPPIDKEGEASSTPTKTTIPTVTHDVTKNISTTNDQVQITASCWNRIQKLVSSKNNPQLYLRVFVDAGGCSGFSYQFELDDTALASDDVVFTSGDDDDNNNNNNQYRLVIDEASLNMLRGSTIDYVQEMIKSSFQVTNNPQSESACGCGSSFALKNFASNPAID
ncbi:iron-sulfur cluster insertion protein [Fistulifera solaris]|uniref:Iron-sulfur cluster insertion protein n=1 Tax=Fistulifera solaris TaxID=1519565 RepID=A0A1Z5KJ10_FISSO|nr:iron-sulfur cluster insertion protein [Fistulifera solaris]|eukprot:GAX26259.1 iron-sulfur cluster insertion protein [Fistulifera solaris]